MMKEYARFDNQSSENYLKEYNLDREKTFRYYLFPADDLAAVYWGYIFEGIKCRCVLVEDNYLIFASSESAVKSFARDYVHGSVIRDAEWYRHLKPVWPENTIWLILPVRLRFYLFIPL